MAYKKNNRELIRPKMMTELQGNTVKKIVVKLLLLYISGYVKDKITFISSVNPELQIILAIIQLSNPQSNFLAC